MDRFLIAPFEVGLETDLRPWLIPDEAFAKLNNAYVFRGRVRKRFGSSYTGIADQLSSRARVLVGTTDSSGDISDTAPGATFAVGQMFSIGSVFYTVNELGTPGDLLKSGGSATVATFNTTTGALVINGADASTGVWFYPSTPIMGFTQYESGTATNKPSFAFDTQFAYKYSGGAWNRDGTAIWTGTDDQFFWSCNWRSSTTGQTALFTTNFNVTPGTKPSTTPVGDPIYYYTSTGGWTAFRPAFNVPSASNSYCVQSSRLIVPFKGRLLLMNTIESDSTGTTYTQYNNRVRYSANGDPTASGAFYEPGVTGYIGGDYIDAPIKEAIVSCGFIKDHLIVYFERSTWELADTGSPAVPFVWQRINTELGSEATFSSVPFDKVVLTIGNTGIHACSGANVVRVDDKIPQVVFDISNKAEGVVRVAGIRDYFAEMVYWTFPAGNESTNDTFPNRVLVFNYKNGAWAFNDDSITAWGYFEQQDGYTWQSTDFSWVSTNNTWESGTIQSQFRQVIAGNQQGFIFNIVVDRSQNAPVLQVTDISVGLYPYTTSITCINHNLTTGDFVQFYDIDVFDTTINYQISSVTDANTFEISAPFAGTYLGGGTIARVSNIQIQSKQWNPYVKDGRNFQLVKFDFGVQRTSSGAITVDYSTSGTQLSMITEAQDSDSILGTGILETYPYTLYPLESAQDRLWHPLYINAEGTSVQINMYLSYQQLQDQLIANSDFQLEGLVLHTQPSSSRIQ